MPAYRLITMGPSHYCEKARWALERFRIPYKEEPHMPGWHMLATRRARGRSVPVLVTDTTVYSDSTDILEFVDRQASGGLFGSGAERREVSELEDRFDHTIGPDTRRLVYWYALDNDALMVDSFGHGVSRAERAGFRALKPMIKRGMRKMMTITAAGADASHKQLDTVFGEVDARLADGRKFLAGDRFTAADLTFAALAAPVTFPPQYGWPLPDPTAMGAPFSDLIKRCRQTRAGEFALRLYAEERRRVVGPSGGATS